MKINQLSVFLENQPGRLSEPCAVLARAGINILTLSLADTQQFGILRLIVKDWQRAQAELEKAGCLVKRSEVVAVEVEDTPGGLERLLTVIEEGKVNVEYMYAFSCRCQAKAIMIFCFGDPDKAISVMQAKGINVMSGGDLLGV
ncbi:MAG: hypothetical protein JW745_01255 [Sedimentisphaerales bacterium]|nr:hypothetical protein [Sedimentisphaerales bacterium]